MFDIMRYIWNIHMRGYGVYRDEHGKSVMEYLKEIHKKIDELNNRTRENKR